MEFSLDKLVRENIKRMQPYSSARHEFSGKASIFLDANENSFGSPLSNNYNRYPDPLQSVLKEKISEIKGVPAKNIFLGNGSDEAIDLLMRILCEPSKDNILIFPPTYGMYEVCAQVNDLKLKKVLLTEDFQLDLDAIQEAVDSFTKLVFICSPNNPTGNSIRRSDIEILLNNFDGIVVIDEAYINYAKQKTFIPELIEYPNLVILQTLSKAWGLAALRIGMAFASEPIIDLLNKIKYPYNINQSSQELALQALNEIKIVNEWIKITVDEREKFSTRLNELSFVKNVYPSDANFILVKIKDAKTVYEYLLSKEIIVRDRSKIILCEDCLRITIGTPEENTLLLNELNNYKAK